MKTQITQSSTRGATTYVVWYQCPISKIFQADSTHETMKGAKAAAKALRS